MTAIKIDISKRFDSLLLFSNLKLEFAQNKIYSIVGPTGCGKTTLLNIISKIEMPTDGEVKISTNLTMGYLLQENVMLPWRTLVENISLSLEIKGGTRYPDKNLISKYIDQFELKGFENYYPDALSGGMKQRASLIRCLLTKPNILLLDEPFSNLDFDIKLKIQKELLAYQKQINATIIIVTHDIEDAIALSDYVIILTSKPTAIKDNITIDLGLIEKDPIHARTSKDFSNYFKKIWSELKYLSN